MGIFEVLSKESVFLLSSDFRVQVPGRSYNNLRFAGCCDSGIIYRTGNKKVYKMALSWYAMRSKPNKEDFLAGQLRAHGVDVFFPVLRVKPANPRSRKLRAYFPNYLFVYVDLDTVNVSDLRWMPGASGLVSFDGEPASVPDTLITAVKKQVDQYNATFHEQGRNFKPGEAVMIEDGPFAGYEAVFDTQISGQDRVRVLLSLLQGRNMPVEMASRQIRRAKRSQY